MRRITEQELKDILDKHGKWLVKKYGGEWRISKMLNNEYWVSSKGEIASIFNSASCLREYPNRIKPQLTTKGYLTMTFRKKHILVHRIIADEFISTVDGFIVHHKNGVRTQNSVKNLIVTSPSVNNKHACVTKKLNKKIITEMIRYYRSGL